MKIKLLILLLILLSIGTTFYIFYKPPVAEPCKKLSFSESSEDIKNNQDVNKEPHSDDSNNSNNNNNNKDEKASESSIVVDYLISYLSLAIAYLIVFIIALLVLKQEYFKDYTFNLKKKDLFPSCGKEEVKVNDYEKNTHFYISSPNTFTFCQKDVLLVFDISFPVEIFVIGISANVLLYLLEDYLIFPIFALFKDKKKSFYFHWQELSLNRTLRNILGKLLGAPGSILTIFLYVFLVSYLLFRLAVYVAYKIHFPKEVDSFQTTFQ